MKVYLAGPMSGYTDFNFPAFAAGAAMLRAKGYEVVNPAEVNPDTTLTWEACLKADIPELLKCEGIVLMDGWTKSRGATLEAHIAQELRMPVLFLKDLQ
jgi:hypothetical protein